jgi:hypothetical protein
MKGCSTTPVGLARKMLALEAEKCVSCGLGEIEVETGRE